MLPQTKFKRLKTASAGEDGEQLAYMGWWEYSKMVLLFRITI